ncbi:uncharacterized protein FFB20_02868 [Fusarium fujikuroi]|nr:uncharacterized protein FFB20_02868 [Fusarium fujikuroi]SCN90684.1 uncharacterized protein FFE2_07056 [Fusarium fujikuroi]SCN98440.1 uncharacterized protein FFM5_06834 [Fusarium fujikuroi]SCO19303.1 uncharacterized protein FFC1_13516 [Fusarium fujikuroi]SCO43626.1 uncharacterized protein FFNC_09255 [Fusarium fujikuroi]
MDKVVCECGKTVKSQSALAQHERDSSKHRQRVESTGSGDHSLSSDPVSNPSNTGTAPSSSRYPPIRFVKAGTSIKHIRRKWKGGKLTKNGSGTGPEMPQLRVNEYGKPYVSGLDDEDWSLCYKDCGWCGHCADGVDL